MSHTSAADNTNLPSFEVNVVPVSRVNSENLCVLLDLFRHGESEPLFLGAGNQPEAAIIPMDAFMRLIQYDHQFWLGHELELTRRVTVVKDEMAHGHVPGIPVEEAFERLSRDASPDIADILKNAGTDND